MKDLRQDIVDALEGKDETTRMFERYKYLRNNWETLSEEEKETAEPTQSSVNQRSESPLLFDLEMESDTNT